MIGSTISPPNPSNQDGNSSKSSSGNTFLLGSNEFPSLIPSTSLSNVRSEKGISENPNPDVRQKRLGMSYVGCLNNNTQSTTSTKLNFDEAKMIDGQSTAIFSSGELKSQISLCESYVVGYFVEKKLPFHLVKESLKSQWNLKGDFTMTIHGEKAYMFKFNQEDDREKVLEMGSVFMAKNLFIIQPWSVSLEQTIDSITTVPIWMNLRKVPFHLWNKLGLSRIASIVGVPIMTDTPTALKTRMAYARVLVEVSGDCSFPSELPIQIDGVKSVVKAEYPWRPKSCSHCKSFGHSSDKCSLHPAPKVVTKWVPKTKSVAANLVKEGVSTMVSSSEDRVVGDNVEVIADANGAQLQLSENGASEEVITGENGDASEVVAEEDNESGSGDARKDTTSLMDNVIFKFGVEHNKKVDKNENPFSTKEMVYSRKFKRAPRREVVSDEAFTSCMNSFSLLVEESSKTSNDVGKDLNDGNDYVNDIDDLDVGSKVKVKSLAEIPRRIPLSKEQEIERIVKAGALLGVKQEGKTQEEKKVHREIMDRQAKERTAVKGMDDTASQKLGRGKRTSVKKKLGV